MEQASVPECNLLENHMRIATDTAPVMAHLRGLFFYRSGGRYILHNVYKRGEVSLCRRNIRRTEPAQIRHAAVTAMSARCTVYK